MAKIKTNDGALGDFRRLLDALGANATQLPDVEAERAGLEKALADGEDAQTRQVFHTAGKQRATQDLTDALARGRDLATQLRGAARFKLGLRDENLVQFRITPLRKRGAPKTQAAKPPTPPAESAPPAAAPTTTKTPTDT